MLDNSKYYACIPAFSWQGRRVTGESRAIATERLEKWGPCKIFELQIGKALI